MEMKKKKKETFHYFEPNTKSALNINLPQRNILCGDTKYLYFFLGKNSASSATDLANVCMSEVLL